MNGDSFYSLSAPTLSQGKRPRNNLGASIVQKGKCTIGRQRSGNEMAVAAYIFSDKALGVAALRRGYLDLTVG